MDAEPVQALVVRVLGEGGRPAAGEVVRFEPVAPAGSPFHPGYHLVLSPLDGGYFSGTMPAVDTTDERGRAAVRVKLGTRTGVARVRITVAALGLQDTSSVFTVRPGIPRQILATPADTAVQVGRMFTAGGALLDRHGNEAAGTLSFSRLSGPITVSGATVTGDAFGRASYEVRGAGMADTAWVTVVPEGTIAVHTADKLFTLELDGSNLRTVATARSGYPGMYAAWTADGSKLVFQDYDASWQRVLYVVELTTLHRWQLVGPESGLALQENPVRSGDGNWILFDGAPSYPAPFWVPHRVRPDGTGLEVIGPAGAVHPALSSDGRTLVYQGPSGLELRDLVTGSVTQLGVTGDWPVWAPSGDEIYFLDVADPNEPTGRVRAVRPDGTGLRTLGSAGTVVHRRVSVSPDGRYLIGRLAHSDFLVVIEIATGAEVTLPFRYVDGYGIPYAFDGPVWKPASPPGQS